MHVKLENPGLDGSIKLARSQKDSLFQKCWCCVARIIFVFPKPGSNTRSIKVKTFSMAFQYGLCYIGSRILQYVSCPGGGGGISSFCSQRGFSSRVMKFQAAGGQVTLLRDFSWFCWKEQSKILVLLHLPNS